MATIPFNQAPIALTPGSPLTIGPQSVSGFTSVTLKAVLVAQGGIAGWTNPANYPPALAVTVDPQHFDTRVNQWVSDGPSTWNGGHLSAKGTMPGLSVTQDVLPFITQVRVLISVNQNTTLGASGSVVTT